MITATISYGIGMIEMNWIVWIRFHLQLMHLPAHVPINSNKFPLSANLLSEIEILKAYAEIIGCSLLEIVFLSTSRRFSSTHSSYSVCVCFFCRSSSLFALVLLFLFLTSVWNILNKNNKGSSTQAFVQFIYIRTWWMWGKGRKENERKNCNISRTLKLTLRALCVSSGRVWLTFLVCLS